MRLCAGDQLESLSSYMELINMIPFKRRTRSLKSLIWLVVVLMLCIWMTRFSTNKPQPAILETELSINNRLPLLRQLEPPPRAPFFDVDAEIKKEEMELQLEQQKQQQQEQQQNQQQVKLAIHQPPEVLENISGHAMVTEVNKYYKVLPPNTSSTIEHNNTKVPVNPNITFECTESIKRNNYMYLDFQPGRTGNALFQVFCLLSLSSKYCYTPIVKKPNRFFRNLLDPVFEVDNIKRIWKLNSTKFVSLANVLSPEVQFKLANLRQNWMLTDRCVGYRYLSGQEQYVRSSVKFKQDIQQEVDWYMDETFRGRSTVAIHVRRTDKMTNEDGYEYSNLEWYRPYIYRAMGYIRSKETNIAFIFVSDDLQWCRENFHGPDVYFSPCTTVGCDLALVTRCDHVIITIGTYGWMGAWLGEHRIVIYNSKYVPKRFYKNDFFLPSWIGLE